MASEILKRKLNTYSNNLIAEHGFTNDLPAVIIGAERGALKKVDKSGPVPTPLSPYLRDPLEELGPIGTKGIDYIIGCCCEVRASNQVLIIRPASPRSIQFTKAIRPRTGQVIPRCRNCRHVFGNGI